MGMTLSNDVKIAEMQTDNDLKKVEEEWRAKKDMDKARIGLEEKKLTLEEKKYNWEYSLKKDRLENEKSKTKLHMETQAAVINKILEVGFDSEDYCVATAVTYMTLKEQLSTEETEQMSNIVDEMMKRKQHKIVSMGGNGSPPPQYHVRNETE